MRFSFGKQSALSAAVASALALVGVSASVAPAAGDSLSNEASGAVGTSVDAIIGTGADAIIGTGADAIIGTGADAIIGTGADAIIGTGADAIIGTGADAIIGTGADAIIGTGADAIIGTGADAIIGTGADAIIGTGADAIIGTGADAIIGTGAEAIIGTGADAISGAGIDVSSAPSADQNVVALLGPVESADSVRGTIKVFGRTLRAPADSGLAERLSADIGAGRLVQVAVTAGVGLDGELLRASVKVIPDQYVPGVSKVVLSGRIKTVDTRSGQAVVGKTVVDYTSLLSNGELSVKAGDVVLVRGTQPQLGGRVLAAELKTYRR